MQLTTRQSTKGSKRASESTAPDDERRLKFADSDHNEVSIRVGGIELTLRCTKHDFDMLMNELVSQPAIKIDGLIWAQLKVSNDSFSGDCDETPLSVHMNIDNCAVVTGA